MTLLHLFYLYLACFLVGIFGWLADGWCQHRRRTHNGFCTTCGQHDHIDE